MKGDHHMILRVIAKCLIPLILIYAFYVQFHGEVGAGGAFQAGVVLAVALILHSLVFGLTATMRAVPPWFTRALSAVGVLVYAGVGVGAATASVASRVTRSIGVRITSGSLFGPTGGGTGRPLALPGACCEIC